MTLSRREAFGEISNVERMMNRLFEEPTLRPFRWFEAGPRMLAMDVYETDGEIVCKAALPGFSEEDVETSVEGSQLTIRARRPAEKYEPENVRWVCHELWPGEFVRTVTLPTGLNAEKAEANLENGILTITVPKAEEAKPKQIKLGARGKAQAPARR